MNQFIKILIITVLLSINAFSQKLSEMHVVGNAEFLSSELIDKNIKDANGETCAGLIIQSDLTGLNYTSYNGIVKVNKNSGKDFLFLSADERVVEVFCDGFASLKIILNDYGIKLESGKVWQIKITGEKKNTSGLIPVKFDIIPEDASFILDSTPYSVINTIQIVEGKHTIKISKPGYKTVSEEISVSKSNIYFKYNLTEIDQIKLTVRSNPEGAKIYLNDAEKGETNKDLWVYPGMQRIKLSMEGYVDIQADIEVKDGIKNGVKYDMEKNIGELHLTVLPEDAEVLINKINYSGKNTIVLIPGKYQIAVTKPNYFTVNDSIDIELGKRVEKTYNLIKSTGELQLAIEPSDAEVLINNVNYTGKNTIELTPGKYQIAVSKPNYFTINENVDIEIGKRIEKTYSLLKSIGELRLTVLPTDAEVLINKENYTGKNIINLPPGKNKVEITKENYYSISDIIDSEPGKVLDKSYSLLPLTGKLQISIQPIDANVTIKKNGKVVKQFVGSDMVKNIQIGKLTIEAVSPGYRKLTKELAINENATTNIELLMEKGADQINIGIRIWMTENLNVDHFKNGDIIPEARTTEEWIAAGNNGKPAWCYYNNDSKNGIKYGKLYNWYAVNDPRGLAPDGWHIPTNEEFRLLMIAVGNNSNALKSVGQGHGTFAGTNTSGFSALLYGARNNFGAFYNIGNNSTNFWSSTEYDGKYAYSFGLGYNNSDMYLSYNSKGYGFFVRYVKY